MAKYRITSIPQFRDGGRKNKKQSVQTSNWNAPVQGFNPQSALTAFMPNTPIVEQPDLYNVDPMYQNPQEIPWLENLDRKLKKIYLPQKDSQGLYDELLPEDCPPGMVPYKGECVSKIDYDKLMINENYEQDERNINKLAELYDQMDFVVKNRGLEQEQTFIANLEDYFNKSIKQKKTEKLKPFMTKPDSSEAGDYWYTQKNANGEYDYYPKDLINHLIYSRGIRPNQNLAMIGDLDQDKFKEDFKEIIAIADNDFNVNQIQELNKLIKSGMSAEEARNELVKRNSLTKKGAENLFKNISEELDVYYNADKYQTDDEGYLWKTTTDGKKYKYVNKNNQYETVTNEETQGIISSENPLGLKSSKIKNQMNSDWEWVEDKNLDKFYTYPYSNKIYKQNTSGQWFESSDGKNWGYIAHGLDGSLDLSKALKDNILKPEHKPAQYTDYNYNLRGDENKVLKKFTQTVDDVIKYDEDQTSATQKQNSYAAQNSDLYDYVYGNKTTEKYPTNEMDNPFVSSKYDKLRAEAIKKINATSDKKEQQKIFSEFYEQVKTLPKEKVSDFTIDPSNLPAIGFSSGSLNEEFSMSPISINAYAQRDPNAYKNSDALKQVTGALDKKDIMYKVLANYNAFTDPMVMRYSDWAGKKVREQGSGAYDIDERKDPSSINQENVSKMAEEFYDKYPTFESYLNDPSVQKVINENPDLLRTGLNVSNFVQTKAAADKYYNEAEARMNKIKSKRDADIKALSMMFPTIPLISSLPALPQIYGLFSDPLYTLKSWSKGKLANSDIIFGSDDPNMLTRRGDELYGPGAGELIAAENAKESNFVRSGLNVFNPFHWAKEAGIGLGDKASSALGLSAGDPDNRWRDIGLNLVFAGAAPAKLMGAKLLPKIANANKLSKAYNFVRSAATPGNALHGYFLKEGFVPYTDEEGNTQQGFVVDAAMRTADNISKMYNQGFSNELLNEIGYDLPALYMGYGMLKPHARQLRSFARGQNPFQSMYSEPPVEPDPTITPEQTIDRRGAMNKLGGDVSTKFNKTELPLARYGRFKRKNSKSTPEPTPEPKSESEIRPKYEQLEFQFPTEVPSVVPETPLASEINTAAENQNFSITPLKGLNLKLTADPNSAFYKAINPKTGEINFEQALSLFRKTAGGDEVLRAMAYDPDMIGDIYSEYYKLYHPEPDKNKTNLLNVPAKTLLEYMQQSIPSLNREISYYVPEGLTSVATRGLSGFGQTPNSVYGLHNIYPDAHAKRVFGEYTLGQNQKEGIWAQLRQNMNDNLRILKEKKDQLNGFKAAGPRWEPQAETVSQQINDLEQIIENYKQNQDKQLNFAIFKPRTIQFSNESDFGLGSSKHRNKDTTLGHVHAFEDPYDPDGLYTFQIQSDAATSYSRLKDTFQNINDKNEKYFDEEGYLRALLSQSTNRGMPFTQDVLADTPIEAGPEITDDYQVENIKRFLPQKKTLLTNKKSTEKRLLQETLNYAASIGKKYIYIPTPELSTKIQGNDYASSTYKQYKKHYIKLFGESGVKEYADQFGNKWLKLEVPESYSKGEGIIEAYKEGGYVSTKLTQKEIDKYVKGGYIVEDE